MSFETWLSRIGHIPLPPYIDRPDEPEDRERYQTIFARDPGSVAAPTAGLHFTDEVAAAIRARGASIERVTLHVGPGTFRPVATEDPHEHVLDSEPYRVPPETAAAIHAARERRRRILAIGTTAVRSLESWALAGEPLDGAWRETGLFILPPYDFRVIDGMITNFHLPKSSLLMLVSALAGRERVLGAYREAVARGYRFYSYGDAMLIV
jgi:S-adenosylmethionine:tRNA ribosyltransferase-isomerase